MVSRSQIHGAAAKTKKRYVVYSHAIRLSENGFDEMFARRIPVYAQAPFRAASHMHSRCSRFTPTKENNHVAR